MTETRFMVDGAWRACGMAMALSSGVLSAVAWSSPVLAAVPSAEEIARQVEALSQEGRARYGARDYEGAIALFEEAYALEPVPNLLYNIARCHEKLEDWTGAIKHYEQFVLAPDIERADRKAAMDRMDKLREIRAAQGEMNSGEERAGRESDPITSSTSGDVGAGETSRPPGRARSRVPGAVFVGLGLAAAGGGALFGVKAQREHEAFEAATTTEQRQEARVAGEQHARLADGLYIGGGVALVTGVIFLVRASRSVGEVSQGPTPSSDVSRATFTWAPWRSERGSGGALLVSF